MTNQQGAPEALRRAQYLTVVYRDIKPGDEARELIMHPKMTASSWSHVMNERDRLAALVEAQQPAPAPQADSQLAPQGEPWYGHHFKEVRRGYWQCSCGKAIAEATSTTSNDCYPPLPNRHAYDDDGDELFTANQMRAFADATHALRASRGQAPACQHRIVDARNPIIKSGYVCLDCGALFAAGDHDAAQAPSVLEDAARLDFLIEQRAYVVSDPDTCPGYWLHFIHKETGKCWVQYDEHPTPRAAIDAAMKAGGAT